ncbi:MAG: hypothetical protein M3340_02030 [Actinomycetota bacterium]|nr:hypothetical protein [Actinomycetota bacterium]
MRRALTLLAIAAAAAGATACDDDDGDDGRTDFHRQADRICRQSGIRPKAVPGDLPQAARLLAEEARLRADVYRKLRGLDPPAEHAGRYERFLFLTAEVARGLNRMSGIARRGDRARLARLDARTAERERERQRLAREIGFLRCGRPITESPLERE